MLLVPPLLLKEPMLAFELDKNTQAEAQLLIKFSSLLDAHFRFVLLLRIVLFLTVESHKDPFPSDPSLSVLTQIHHSEHFRIF